MVTKDQRWKRQGRGDGIGRQFRRSASRWYHRCGLCVTMRVAQQYTTSEAMIVQTEAMVMTEQMVKMEQTETTVTDQRWKGH